MQALDENGQALGSLMIGKNEEETRKELLKLHPKTKKIVIGKIPKKDQVIEIQGLMYKVTYVDGALGKLFLKLI